jgi:branched-chain amino acid aminotransferase
VTTTAQERDAVLRAPGFGAHFTDHMASVRWTEGRGWHDDAVHPFRDLTLSPAAMGLHYGQVVFEGFKAFRQTDGAIALFRPARHAERFNASARRMAMPEIEPDRFVALVRDLVAADRKWVPDGRGRSLYLRPIALATEPHLGFRPARSYALHVIASPVAPMFPTGPEPLTAWVEADLCRAGAGGTGAAKCAGNYGSGLLAQERAFAHGCDTVLWLDPETRGFAEELGNMNLFVAQRRDGRTVLTTPPLTGTVLAGVTRDALMTLARDLGVEVREAPIPLTTLTSPEEHDVVEAFACGTAAVVVPLGGTRRPGGESAIGGGDLGATLRERLLAIQHGEAADAFDWMRRVVDPA